MPLLGCVLAVAGLATCGSPVAGTTLPGRCALEPPVLTPQQTDILFVIDNSNSMAEEQATVATELPVFLQALESGPVENNYRVAVITTSVYQRANVPAADGGTELRLVQYTTQSGRLQPVPEADGGVSAERFLASGDPQLLDKFRRLIRVGTSGSGQETPFEAVRLALSPPLSTSPASQGGTQDFLRDGARLLVVVVSDEDDCSENVHQAAPEATLGLDKTIDYCRNQLATLTPTSAYHDFLLDLHDGTGTAREVVWAAIAPVGLTNKDVGPIVSGGELHNVDCPTSFQPGYRHKEMAGLFDPTFGNLDSICNASFSQSLIRIAEIANTPTSVEVMNAPDPALMQVSLTRADGTVDLCTVANGGIRYEAPQGQGAARVFFQNQCARRPDDVHIAVKLLCID